MIRRSLPPRSSLVNQIAEYIISAGGSASGPCWYCWSPTPIPTRERRTELASVVEFIHTATLLRRRGRRIVAALTPCTANALFGNAASVLVGDFIHCAPSKMMVGLNNKR